MAERAPDWYRVQGQRLFWDGQRWLDKAGLEVAGIDAPAVRASPEAPSSASVAAPRQTRRVPSAPFVVGVVSLLAGLVLLFLPAGQEQANNLDIAGAAHAVFVQYGGGFLLAVNGCVWLAAGAVIAYLR